MSARPLTVVNVAYPHAAVTPATAGGAEQVVLQLDDALARAGHRSIVVARTGSSVRGRLVELGGCSGLIDDRARRSTAANVRAALNGVLASEFVDVVHLHGVDFAEYLPAPGPPVLATLHLPPSWYPPDVFAIERPATFLSCVSESQRASCPPRARILATVGNGVDVDLLRPSRETSGYVAALGRICPEKGLHLALDAARLAGVPMVLAGTVHPYAEHQAYFERHIEPRLDAFRTLAAAVGGERKRDLLARAACVLVASQVPETSCLVAMEALACGTPVIAFAVGALPEVVDDGHTGFLVHTSEEMARAIHRVHTIDRERCRRVALERFSRDRMAREYMGLYAAIAPHKDREPGPTLRAGAGTPPGAPGGAILLR